MFDASFAAFISAAASFNDTDSTGYAPIDGRYGMTSRLAHDADITEGRLLVQPSKKHGWNQVKVLIPTGKN